MAMINKRYNIISLLGKGGFGEVYKVEDTYENDKILAIKKIRSSILTERSVNIFKFEFKFLTSLNHPNLVKVYDFNIDKASDELFFTMEYIHGLPLDKACQQHKDWNLIENYLVESARALAYIHSKEIIHYDIKPDNILIDSNNNLKIMDFGFAGSKEDSKVRGTIQFLAPDFVRKTTITNKVDFFSLGATFYYSITGQLPFIGCTKEEMLKKCAIGDYIPIQELVPDIPDHLAEIIKKLMQTNPQDRYDCATEIISDINHFTCKNYHLFTKNGIQAYIKSGKLFGRKQELETLSNYAYSVLEKENYYDNLPLFISSKDGYGKKSILREFRYLIQLKEDIDYFTANFFAADENIYQAFEVIIEEMIRLYNFNINDYPDLSFLFATEQRLEELEDITVKSDEANRQDQILAICDFLAKTASRHAMVIDLRNFNNASSASILLLENLIRVIRKEPEREIKIVLIISVQSDKLPAYHKIFLEKIRADIQNLELSEFTLEQTDEYIRELLLIKSFPENYTRSVFEITKGIPYYINELFIYMFDKDILSRDKVSWTLDADFHKKIELSNQEITHYNYKLFSPLEQIIIKELFILERPASFKMLPVLEKLSTGNLDEIQTALHILCNKDIIEKIKYSDGYRYFLANDLFLEAVKDDFTQQEYINFNRVSADFIKNNFGINSKTIYSLADYYFRSKEKEKTLGILKAAVNKGYEDCNYELTLVYLEKLFLTEENITKQQNIFIAILSTLELLHNYQAILYRINDFFREFRNITVHNLLEINLKKHSCSIKLGYTPQLAETTAWFLGEAAKLKFSRDDEATYCKWLGLYYFSAGDIKHAYNYLKKAESIYLKLEKHLSAASVGLEIARVAAQNGKLLKVQKRLLNSLSVFEHYQEYPEILKTYELLGDNYAEFDHDDKALEYYQECINLSKNRNDLKAEIKAEIKIAKLKARSLLLNESQELLNKNIPLLPNIDDLEIVAEINYQIAQIYFLTGRLPDAEMHIDLCIETNSRLNRNAAMIKAYLLKNDMLIFNNQIPQANLNLEKVKDLINKHDSINLSQFYLQNGLIASSIDKKQSKKFFNKFLDHIYKPVTLSGLIILEQQKSRMYELLGKPKSAIEHARSAFEIFYANLADLKNRRIIKSKTEILYHRLRAYSGEHEEAIQGITQLITYLESYNIPLEKGLAKFYLGKIYFDLGDANKSTYFFDSARRELQKVSKEIFELKEINRIYPERKLFNRTVVDE